MSTSARAESSFSTRPVLVLGGTTRVVTAIARSLHRRDIPVDVASLWPGHPPRTFSRAVRNHLALPDYRQSAPAFIEALVGLIHDHGFDMLIPSTDDALLAIYSHYETLRGFVNVACPGPLALRYVLDKRLTLQAARECGVLIPRTFEIDELRSPLTSNQLQLPLVAKRASKFSGQDCEPRYFDSYRELADASAEDPDFCAQYLLQEYCEGEGIGIDVLLWDGEPRAVFQHRRLRESPIRGGASTLSESQQPDPDLVEKAVALLRRLGWQGVAMVEFRYNHATRRATLMEINGRYWGSLGLALRAGLDFPLYQWQLLHGEDPKVPSHYQPGLRLLWRLGDAGRAARLFPWYWSGHLKSRALIGEWIRFARDLLSATIDAVWCVRDPLPAFMELYAKVTRAIRPNRIIPRRSGPGLRVK